MALCCLPDLCQLPQLFPPPEQRGRLFMHTILCIEFVAKVDCMPKGPVWGFKQGLSRLGLHEEAARKSDSLWSLCQNLLSCDKQLKAKAAPASCRKGVS